MRVVRRGIGIQLMKFLVLCSFQLRRADGRALQSAMEVLASAGFRAIGHQDVAADPAYGIPRCVVGEFRGPAEDALVRRIESDLRLHFAGRGLDAEFTLRAQALRDEQDSRGGVAV